MRSAEDHEPRLGLYAMPALWSLERGTLPPNSTATPYEDTVGFSCLISGSTIRADVTLTCKSALDDTMTSSRPQQLALQVPDHSWLSITEHCAADRRREGNGSGTLHDDILKLWGLYRSAFPVSALFPVSANRAEVQYDETVDTWIPAASDTTIEVAIAFRNAASGQAETFEVPTDRDGNPPSEFERTRDVTPGEEDSSDDDDHYTSLAAVRARIEERRRRREAEATGEGRSD